MAQWKKIVTSGSSAALSSLTLDTALPVAQGGIGATSLNNLITLTDHTQGNYVKTISDAGSSRLSISNGSAEGGEVTIDIANNAVGMDQLAGITSGKIIIGDGSGNPSLVTPAGDVTIASDGTTAIGSDKVLPSMMSLFDDSLSATDGALLIGDGSDISAVTLSGPISITNAGATSIAGGSIDTTELAADAVTGAKIADDAIDSEHITADSIDTEHYAAGSVDSAALDSSAVTSGKINADAVTGPKIAEDAVDSEHIAADSIDTEHYAPASVDSTAKATTSETW